MIKFTQRVCDIIAHDLVFSYTCNFCFVLFSLKTCPVSIYTLPEFEHESYFVFLIADCSGKSTQVPVLAKLSYW